RCPIQQRRDLEGSNRCPVEARYLLLLEWGRRLAGRAGDDGPEPENRCEEHHGQGAERLLHDRFLSKVADFRPRSAVPVCCATTALPSSFARPRRPARTCRRATRGW